MRMDIIVQALVDLVTGSRAYQQASTWKNLEG